MQFLPSEEFSRRINLNNRIVALLTHRRSLQVTEEVIGSKQGVQESGKNILSREDEKGKVLGSFMLRFSQNSIEGQCIMVKEIY